MNFARIWCITNRTPARRVTPPWNVYMAKFDPGWEGYPVWQTGSPGLASCKRDQIIMRDYMDRRVTSPTWGPSPSCKQALKFRSHVKIRIRPRVSLSLLETYFRNRIIRPQWYSHSLLHHSQPIPRARLPASVWEISPCPFLGGWSFLPHFPFPPPPLPSLFLSWGQFNKTFTSVISKCNYCFRTLDRQTLVKVLLL